MNPIRCVSLIALLLIHAAHADSVPAHIIAAVSDPSRPADDVLRDIERKPVDVLAFAGIEPGDKVADFMAGQGYFTRILCKAVARTGHVYAIFVPRAGAAENSGPTVQALAPACDNVTAIMLEPRNFPAPELYDSSGDPGVVYEYRQMRLPAESFTTPEPLDVIWTAESYHDLHTKSLGSPDLSLVNATFLHALKPGGILVIEDHAAKPGRGALDAETLHRIDAEWVKREVIAAGFEFVASSKLLQHAEDAHTVKAHAMHDKTDRFLLKFRKPIAPR